MTTKKQKKCALITGAAGFIGSHLCDRLIAKNYFVVGVDNLHLGRRENIAHLEKNENFEFVLLDVNEREKLGRLFADKKPSLVWHMAANSDIPAGVDNPDVDFTLTLKTTYETLLTCRQYNVKELIFASTSAIFGEVNHKLAEDFSPMRPISFYGASKLSAEAFVSVYALSFEIKSWIFRFPNVVGERATHGVIYDFLKKLSKDKSRLEVLGNGTQNKTYLYIGDLLDAMFFAYDNAKEQLNVFNVGPSSNVTVAEIAQIVLEEAGCASTKIEYTGGDRGWRGDVPYFEYDTSRLNALGWKTSRSSAEAIRLAVRAILKNKEFRF